MGFEIRRATLAILVASRLAPVAVAQRAGNWARQIPQNFPIARQRHALAYDAAHGQVVLFGGDGGNLSFTDTWVWDGTNWTQKSPSTSPPGLSGHAMAYDSAHRQVILFGGFGDASTGFAARNDTWGWDGTNWTHESAATSPPGRFQHALAYDSVRGQVVLFGGSNEVGMVFNDTWVWDGVNWTQKSPQTSPPARYRHAMAYDSAHDQIVLFGGAFFGPDLNDTWVWDGENWAQKSPMVNPPARDSHAMAYDSVHGQMVLFGGGPQGPNNSSSVLNDTWTWDGTNWIQQSPRTSPLARASHAMAYDSSHSQVVLFGGTVFGVILSQYFSDTWTWSGGPLAPVITAVVNGASFLGGGVVPGEIATAFGTNLTSSTGINLTSSLPLPTTFLTDSVMVNNHPAALFAVDNVNGQQQINFQVPWEVASGPMANIVVDNNGAMSASLAAPVLAAQPGIFNYSAGGKTFGAILHANFQLADTGHPAKAGETVLVYCTGLGAVASPPADGAAGNGQETTTTPTVTIGGTKAIVSFSGLAPGFVGLYQINVEVPAALTAGNQPVVVMLAGASSNSVLLPVS